MDRSLNFKIVSLTIACTLFFASATYEMGEDLDVSPRRDVFRYFYKNEEEYKDNSHSIEYKFSAHVFVSVLSKGKIKKPNTPDIAESFGQRNYTIHIFRSQVLASKLNYAKF